MLNGKAKYLYKELQRSLKSKSKRFTKVSQGIESKRNNIISSCYNILENIYRANIFQDVNDKKEVVVSIQMLNFYLEEALRKELINNKKFESYVNHLIELDKMVRSWFYYEKSV